MVRDRRRLLEHFSFGKCEQLGGFYRAEVSGTGKHVANCHGQRRETMKISAIGLVTCFALISTASFAQTGAPAGGTGGVRSNAAGATGGAGSNAAGSMSGNGMAGSNAPPTTTGAGAGPVPPSRPNPNLQTGSGTAGGK